MTFLCELADKIREKIMDLFHRRRRIACRLKGNIAGCLTSLESKN
jgi:hypothetical protein